MCSNVLVTTKGLLKGASVRRGRQSFESSTGTTQDWPTVLILAVLKTIFIFSLGYASPGGSRGGSGLSFSSGDRGFGANSGPDPGGYILNLHWPSAQLGNVPRTVRRSRLSGAGCRAVLAGSLDYAGEATDLNCTACRPFQKNNWSLTNVLDDNLVEKQRNTAWAWPLQ